MSGFSSLEDGTRELILIPQGSSFLAESPHSPELGFLHGEAVLVDAGGGHAAAQHVLRRGDVALLGDALQVRQVAVERGL